MLIYLGRGLRRYDLQPCQIYHRPVWEFQAVVDGAIGFLLPDGPDLLKSRRIWLSPPFHPHGWVGEKNRASEVVVFHFQWVPPALESLARQSSSPLEMALTEKQCAEVRRLAEQASRYWEQPSVGMTICFEKILMELSLMFVEGCPGDETARQDGAGERVNRAIRWFVARMEENPSLEEVAKAVGASPSHLRRLFCEVMETPPKKVFDQLRFHRATQLMAEPALTLEIVGERCGFASASVFSRAFKNKFGCSPDVWRAQLPAGRRQSGRA